MTEIRPNRGLVWSYPCFRERGQPVDRFPPGPERRISHWIGAQLTKLHRLQFVACIAIINFARHLLELAELSYAEELSRRFGHGFGFVLELSEVAHWLVDCGWLRVDG